ncbi:hypothetical protein VDG1235_4449 [Verrucomicrobiia bacterium DG1235]|nr:hypothetical protein VDG1235_4449 [Verrucomicrobiae bacterium DG1235]
MKTRKATPPIHADDHKTLLRFSFHLLCPLALLLMLLYSFRLST